MIVVVASAHDARARNIVAHWGPRCATMLTAEDLARPGWSLTSFGAAHNGAVARGQLVPHEQTSGILTLRPCIYAEELVRIDRRDRNYVAAELNAFLLAWLMAQSCPIMNRPTSSCLTGPSWRPAQWTHAAAELGIPVRRVSCPPPHPDELAASEPSVDVITVGTECFGSDDPVLNACAIALARAAGTDLLCTRFSLPDRCFLTAHPWPDLSNPAVLASVRNRLEQQS